MASKTFIIGCLIISFTFGQFCTWNVPGSPQPFSLYNATGFVAQCFADDPNYTYLHTPCSNYVQCGSQLSVMGNQYIRSNGSCVATTSVWDNGDTQPTLMYMDEQTTFHFKYTNGNKPGCETFTMNVYWKCDATIPPPFATTALQTCYANSNCESTQIIPTPYACIPNITECSWYLTGAQDIFTLDEAKGFQAMCYDTSNGIHGYAYTITPCGDFAQCNPGQFSMGIYNNRISGECLGQSVLWDHGATIPTYYDLENGRRGWKFRYSNGNKPGCETFYMNIDYICDPNMPPPFGPASSNDCYSISECEAIMHIPTPYACAVGPTLIESLHNASINMHISSLM